jgi:Tol biopolymer transport system component/tRNA A-37 threonylcarbamoyl transferase component Bud32
MAFTAGTKLGPYEILAPLGAGGMGEVYKARDKRLNRVVAIKVLRSDRVPNANQAERFVREAKSASALNHPNIVSIYDVFRHEEVDCLVMEYITGATLQALIPRGGMPWKEAVRIAVQVADGLRRAHAAGIIHRDIKPSNIIVPDGGPVKILDFGLATFSASAGVTGDDTTLSTDQLTKEGVVVGTISYMSPEQAQGKPVDARSDIFSFGSMLYEMLTGRAAFKEDSAVGTVAAILHNDPAPLAVPDVPQPLLRILSRCLKKKPEDRWQDIGDVKQLLEDVVKDCEAPASSQSAAGGAARSRARQFLWPAIAVLGAAAVLLAYYVPQLRQGSGVSSRADNDAVLRPLTSDGGLSAYPTISRDGKFVAFASDRARENNLDIWIQQIGGSEPVRLTSDPADETDPDFSPDGSVIVFRSEKDGGGIYTVPALGGSPVLLAPLGHNPRFSPDGLWIAYSVGGEATSNPGSAGVFIISVRGGVPRPVHPEMATAANPVWSPGSDRLLVLGRQDGKAPALEQLDWWILPIEGGAPQRTGVFARLRHQNLQQAQFPHNFPIPLEWREESGDRILFNGSSVWGQTDNLWEIDLNGTGAAQRVTLGPGPQRHARWSADGRRLAFAAEDLNFSIWLQPLDAATGAARGSPTRLTDDVSEELTPSVSWDGTRIAYERHGPDHWSLLVRNRVSDRASKLLSSQNWLLTARLSGDGTKVLYTDSDHADLTSIPSAGGIAEKLCDGCGTVMGASTDGKELLYEPLENEDVLIYDTARRATVKLAVRPTPDLILSGSRFSPDGKWVAFHALRNATNTAQIWIAPIGGVLPVPQSEWIAVTDGSKLERDPAWSADGRFLYFISERDGFRCIWGRPLNALTKKPSGEAFPVHHFHSARFSLRHFGSQGYLAGLSAGKGALVFSMGELKGNVWLEERGR